MQKRVAIYSRVSKDTQTTANQLRELDEVAHRMGWIVVERLSDEGISGAKGRDKRPGFDRLMKMVTRKEIDLIACWSVDRLSRSLQHLLSFLHEINDRKVDLYLHQQGLDTSTPAGRAMFSMLGVFAEFERAMISDRIRAGLNRSTKRAGRAPLDAEKERQARKMLASGQSINATARKLKIGVATAHRIKASMAEAA